MVEVISFLYRRHGLPGWETKMLHGTVTKKKKKKKNLRRILPLRALSPERAQGFQAPSHYRFSLGNSNNNQSLRKINWGKRFEEE